MGEPGSIFFQIRIDPLLARERQYTILTLKMTATTTSRINQSINQSSQNRPHYKVARATTSSRVATTSSTICLCQRSRLLLLYDILVEVVVVVVGLLVVVPFVHWDSNFGLGDVISARDTRMLWIIRCFVAVLLG